MQMLHVADPHRKEIFFFRRARAAPGLGGRRRGLGARASRAARCGLRLGLGLRLGFGSTPRSAAASASTGVVRVVVEEIVEGFCRRGPASRRRRVRHPPIMSSKDSKRSPAPARRGRFGPSASAAQLRATSWKLRVLRATSGTPRARARRSPAPRRRGRGRSAAPAPAPPEARRASRPLEMLDRHLGAAEVEPQRPIRWRHSVSRRVAHRDAELGDRVVEEAHLLVGDAEVVVRLVVALVERLGDAALERGEDRLEDVVVGARERALARRRRRRPRARRRDRSRRSDSSGAPLGRGAIGRGAAPARGLRGSAAAAAAQRAAAARCRSGVRLRARRARRSAVTTSGGGVRPRISGRSLDDVPASEAGASAGAVQIEIVRRRRSRPRGLDVGFERRAGGVAGAPARSRGLRDGRGSSVSAPRATAISPSRTSAAG